MRPIEDVLAAHAKDLMAIEGVTMVYQGALEDGTPCIKVGVVETSDDLERAIPESLEGHPVVITETGEIGPLSR